VKTPRSGAQRRPLVVRARELAVRQRASLCSGRLLAHLRFGRESAGSRRCPRETDLRGADLDGAILERRLGALTLAAISARSFFVEV